MRDVRRHVMSPPAVVADAERFHRCFEAVESFLRSDMAKKET